MVDVSDTVSDTDDESDTVGDALPVKEIVTVDDLDSENPEDTLGVTDADIGLALADGVEL